MTRSLVCGECMYSCGNWKLDMLTRVTVDWCPVISDGDCSVWTFVRAECFGHCLSVLTDDIPCERGREIQTTYQEYYISGIGKLNIRIQNKLSWLNIYELDYLYERNHSINQYVRTKLCSHFGQRLFLAVTRCNFNRVKLYDYL